MPDVKPKPRAGAIRLSLMSADQKGRGSASILTIVVGIAARCLNIRSPGPFAARRQIGMVLANPASCRSRSCQSQRVGRSQGRGFVLVAQLLLGQMPEFF